MARTIASEVCANVNPDRCLANQLRLAKLITNTPVGVWPIDPETQLDAASLLAELVFSLDRHLARGGNRPKRWRKST